MIPFLPFLLASAALNTVGTMQAASAQVGALTGQAAQAEVDAVQTEVATAWAQRRSREASARTLGEIRARTAASGLPIAGSPLEVLAEATRQAEVEVQALGLAGSAQARRLRGQGAALRTQARRTGQAGAVGALSALVNVGGAYTSARGGGS